MKISILKFHCNNKTYLSLLYKFVDLEILYLKLNFFMVNDFAELISKIELPLGIKKVYISHKVHKKRTVDEITKYLLIIKSNLKSAFGCEVFLNITAGDYEYTFIQDDILTCHDKGNYHKPHFYNSISDIDDDDYFIIKHGLLFSQLVKIQELIKDD